MTDYNLPSIRRNTKYRLGLRGKGEVYSYAWVNREEAPEKFKPFTPYCLVLVKSADEMISLRLTDLGDRDPFIGMIVEIVTRKLYEEGDNGPIVYGGMARPIDCE